MAPIPPTHRVPAHHTQPLCPHREPPKSLQRRLTYKRNMADILLGSPSDVFYAQSWHDSLERATHNNRGTMSSMLAPSLESRDHMCKGAVPTHPTTPATRYADPYDAKGRRISNQHGSNDKENAPANGEQPRAALKSVVNVSEGEFEGVPGYLKGRSSVDRVNEAIKELNGLLSSRDHLMAQHLSKLSNVQVKQVNAWKELDNEPTRAPGTITVLESDLKATSLRLGRPPLLPCPAGWMDADPFLLPFPGEASSKDVINVLRHLQKLKEIRAPSGEKAYVCHVV